MSEAEFSRLSADDVEALACVLDVLIPPSRDGRLPGAGEIGLARAIEEAMLGQPALQPAITFGLAAFRESLASGGAAGFAELPLAERTQALNDLSASQPAFLPGLVFNLYGAYYSDPRVVRALGIEAWPPHPKGYEMEPMNEALLDEVRSRPPLYRPV